MKIMSLLHNRSLPWLIIRLIPLLLIHVNLLLPLMLPLWLHRTSIFIKLLKVIFSVLFFFVILLYWLLVGLNQFLCRTTCSRWIFNLSFQFSIDDQIFFIVRHVYLILILCTWNLLFPTISDRLWLFNCNFFSFISRITTLRLEMVRVVIFDLFSDLVYWFLIYWLSSLITLSLIACFSHNLLFLLRYWLPLNSFDYFLLLICFGTRIVWVLSRGLLFVLCIISFICVICCICFHLSINCLSFY